MTWVLRSDGTHPPHPQTARDINAGGPEGPRLPRILLSPVKSCWKGFANSIGSGPCFSLWCNLVPLPYPHSATPASSLSLCHTSGLLHLSFSPPRNVFPRTSPHLSFKCQLQRHLLQRPFLLVQFSPPPPHQAHLASPTSIVFITHSTFCSDVLACLSSCFSSRPRMKLQVGRSLEGHVRSCTECPDRARDMLSRNESYEINECFSPTAPAPHPVFPRSKQKARYMPR